MELDPESAHPWNGLGNLFEYYLNQPDKAEKAYRKAIELDPNNAYSWCSLGILIQSHHSKPAEAEIAFRKAIELEPMYGNPWAGLAEVLSNTSKLMEARHCAVTGLSLRPDYGFARHQFLRLSADHSEDWLAVLSSLAKWCVQNPKAIEVFDFTVDGLVRYARLTKPSDALALLSASTDSSAFETVRDALIACDNKDHLHRLAPERQAVALELMKRIQKPTTEVKKTTGKKVRKPLSSRPAPQN
jgi:tetratricopeptide (TPR) repeat protein